MRPALLLVPAVLATAIPTARAQTTIFTDSFDNSPSPLWRNEVGSWTTQSGEYFAQAPSNSPPTRTTLPFLLRDFDFDVDVRNMSDGGIWLRIDDAGANGVLLVMGGNNHSYPGFYWHTVQNGVYSNFMNLSGNVFPFGSDARLHIHVQGDDYQVFMPGFQMPVATLRTNVVTTGHVGLYDYTAGALQFDNVSITVPCSADFNLDGSLNSQDFFDFLSAFFAESPTADFNHNAVINSQDFFDFLGAFFTGC